MSVESVVGHFVALPGIGHTGHDVKLECLRVSILARPRIERVNPIGQAQAILRRLISPSLDSASVVTVPLLFRPRIVESLGPPLGVVGNPTGTIK